MPSTKSCLTTGSKASLTLLLGFFFRISFIPNRRENLQLIPKLYLSRENTVSVKARTAHVNVLVMGIMRSTGRCNRVLEKCTLNTNLRHRNGLKLNFFPLKQPFPGSDSIATQIWTFKGFLYIYIYILTTKLTVTQIKIGIHRSSF